MFLEKRPKKVKFCQKQTWRERFPTWTSISEVGAGPVLEKPPSLPFHPRLAFPSSAPHRGVISSRAATGDACVPVNQICGGGRNATNQEQERALRPATDAAPASSHALVSPLHAAFNAVFGGARVYFCLRCHGAQP